ncbi:hypothetical protein [Saliphagus sp. LR7]|uniref:hypothetical protein n=1 Tax=Saliphagus sp. LR7 TaxID=2282654 RepID=UPI000DF86101|nr:hypothetical protein [Saliphagus sp. LR7]
MSTNQTPQGQTGRISVSDAQAYINGVGIVRFASFDIEFSDESSTEQAVDDYRLHYDRPVRASGSAEVFPTSPAAPLLKQAVLERRIGTAVFALPEEDANDRHKVVGVRFGSWSQDGADDGYMYTVDWDGDWPVA